MITRLYQDIKNTFYNPEFYSQISRIGLSHPFWLFVKLSIISSIVVIAVLSPPVANFVKEARIAAEKEYFPSELEIVFNEGVATTNLTEEPYYISSEIFVDEPDVEGARNLVMINTREDLKLRELEDEEAFFIVSKTSFIFKDGEELRVFRYGDMFTEEIIINRDKVESIVNQFVQKLPVIIFFLSILFFIFLVFAGVSTMLVLSLILSLIAMIINKIRNLRLTYRNIYKLSMYALVPAIVIDIITDITHGLSSFSLLLTATIFTVVLVWNTQPKKSEPEPVKK